MLPITSSTENDMNFYCSYPPRRFDEYILYEVYYSAVTMAAMLITKVQTPLWSMTNLIGYRKRTAPGMQYNADDIISVIHKLFYHSQKFINDIRVDYVVINNYRELL